MSQNTARLALGVAFLACAGTVAFNLLRADAARVTAATAGTSPSGSAYPAIVVPKVPGPAPEWVRPVAAEGDAWRYDLFTPVEVRWDSKASAYMPKGEVAPVEAPFGLRLLALKHPVYRYTSGGYLSMPNPADSIVMLRDTVAGTVLRGKIGQTLGAEGSKVTLLAWDDKAKSVKLKDLALNRELIVTAKPLAFTDKVIATFSSGDSDAVVWTASAVGEKFENEAGSYVIKGIDFEAQSVTVEKTSTPDPVKNKRKTTEETLSPLALAAPVSGPAQ